jgi:formylglycine-generating enzyme required for sulfatase activity
MCRKFQHGADNQSRHPTRRVRICIECMLGLMLATHLGAQMPAQLGVQMYAALSITGEVSSVHTIQYVTNVSTAMVWRCLAIVQLTNKPHIFVDTTAPAGRRFYQTIAQDLAWIPPGTFLMGSPSTELGRGATESPQTTVTFTRGFFMGKHEVTQHSYVSVMGANPSTSGMASNLPVETVRAGDALMYCSLLTQKEQAAGRVPLGWVYGLPTEAQWEYACRAGATTRFSFGDDNSTYTILPTYAWFGDPTSGKSHTVGTRLPNPWGLYDMHGNVWELCLDTMNYTGGSVVDPSPAGTPPMSRGGSWHSFGDRCRSATRNPYDYSNREAWVGFRVVLTPN